MNNLINMLIIGSKAFMKHYPKREARDLDIIVPEYAVQVFIQEQIKGKIVSEKHDCVSVITPEHGLVEIFKAREDNSWGSYLTYEHAWGSAFSKALTASKETLLSIKKAHIHMPHFSQSKFEKHISDYCILMQDLKEDVLLTLTLAHRAHMESLYGKTKTPSLMKTSDAFFDDKVQKVFVHDEIHEVVAHRDKPMYQYYKPDENEVLCNKDMFHELPLLHRIQGVLEEAYVIALERKILPMIYLGGPYWTEIGAFKWALRRICTNLTSGFFRDFACANYLGILETYDHLYVKKFLMAVNSGRIQRIAEKQEVTISEIHRRI